MEVSNRKRLSLPLEPSGAAAVAKQRRLSLSSAAGDEVDVDDISKVKPKTTSQTAPLTRADGGSKVNPDIVEFKSKSSKVLQKPPSTTSPYGGNKASYTVTKFKPKTPQKVPAANADGRIKANSQVSSDDDFEKKKTPTKRKSKKSPCKNNDVSNSKTPQKVPTTNSDGGNKANSELSSDDDFVKKKTPTKRNSKKSPCKNNDVSNSKTPQKVPTTNSDGGNKANSELSSDDDFEKKKTSTKPNSMKSPSKNKGKCPLCSVEMSSKNIARHRLICSRRSRGVASPRKFLCHICSKSFKRSDHLKGHIRKCSSPSKKEHLPRSKCHHPECGEVFFHKTALIAHLRNVHPDEENSQDAVSKEFSSVDDFISWKEKEEERTYSYFSMQAGENRKNGYVYYYCQHDGLGKSHLKNEASNKTKRTRGCGKVKKGNLCIALMKVKKTEENIRVEYYPCHSHPLDPTDFQHQPLARSTYQLIDQQLAWEVSPSKIKIALHNGAFSRENREEEQNERKNNYVSLKLIRERKRKVRNSRRRHKDDAMSVKMLFEELKKEKYNPVIVYKPLGMSCLQGPPEINELPDSNNVFMLGLQTKQQAELFKEGCSKAMLVDDTHNTTQYDLKLMTVMVPDKNNRCWPAAHLITSTMDANVVQYFYKAMSERSPEAEINVVVTDDDPGLIKAAQLGFQKTLRHILCVWHLHQTFQRNIHSQGVPRNLDSELYNDLKAVINCRNLDEFPALAEAFVKKYEAKAPAFIQYFIKYYMSRPEKWAMSYRNFYYANQNTTGANESFHHRLKKKHMKRRPNKRVDDLINILLNIEEDDYSSRKRENIFGVSAGSYDAVLIRHKKGMDMTDDCIVECLPNLTYEVMSSKDKSKQKYHIAIHTLKCAEKTCRNKCKEMECKGLCSHLFTCSCPDKSPLCKHIHKLYSFLLKKDVLQPSDEVDDPIPDDSNNNIQLFSLYDEKESDTGSYNENAFKKLKENVEKLSKMLDSEMSPNSHLVVHANTVIDELLKRIESTANLSTEHVMMQMKPSMHFTSKEKLRTQESQMLPFRRAKKRKKPTNAFNQKLSPNAKERVKKNLLSVLSDYSDNEPSDPEETNGPLDSALASTPHSEPDKSSFTPSLNYVKKLDDVILKVGDIEMSIIDLKSLEMELSPLEVKRIQSILPPFSTGHVSPSVIDAFLFSSGENYGVFTCSSTESNAVIDGSNVTDGLSDIFAAGYKVVMFPAHHKYQWVLISFNIDKAEILYFDPKQQSVCGFSQKLLSNATKNVKEVLNIPKWSIKIIKQATPSNVSSGVQISNFALQVMMGCSVYSPIENEPEFTAAIYSTVVGKCMQRGSHDAHDTCPVCLNSTQATVSITCNKCGQEFHPNCIVFNDASLFVCPNVN